MRPLTDVSHRPRRLGVLATSLLLVAAGVAADTRVDGVRVGRQDGRTRVVFDLNSAPDYRFFALKNPGRVVLDLQDAQLASDIAADFRGTLVEGLRTGDHEGGVLRLVLDLTAGEHQIKRFTLPPDEAAGRGHRLVVDIRPEETGSQAVMADAASAGDVPAAVDVEQTAATTAQQTESGLTEQTAPKPETAAAVGVSIANGDGGSSVPGPDRDQISENAVVGELAADSEGIPSSGATDDVFDDFFNLGGPAESRPRLSGYLETSAAYTYAEPEHWSKLRARLELAISGQLSDNVRYKLAGRLDGDGAYDLEDDFYPGAVRDDQDFEAQIREFYVDFGSGAWTHRVGRQHIVWGEMVGLFLADVVSARDLREFYLQDFEAMRIPQWAWNTQFFAGDHTLELVYVPTPSVDKIGEPGADFYPFALPPGTPVRDDRPSRDLSTYNWGVRGSTLLSGWSLSAYYYDSISVAPTLVLEDDGLVLQYDAIEQFGGTFSKDFGGFVFKGEAVFTPDRRFQSADPTDPAAILTSDALDWVVGTTIPLGDWRWDLQLYGRSTSDYDPRMGFDDDEFGATVLVNYALGSRMELELMALAGLNREDYLLRPKFVWRFRRDWRLQLGADVFGGDAIGLFGPYDDRDRVYLEVKRWF